MRTCKNHTLTAQKLDLPEPTKIERIFDLSGYLIQKGYVERVFPLHGKSITCMGRSETGLCGIMTLGF